MLPTSWLNDRRSRDFRRFLIEKPPCALVTWSNLLFDRVLCSPDTSFSLLQSVRDALVLLSDITNSGAILQAVRTNCKDLFIWPEQPSRSLRERGSFSVFRTWTKPWKSPIHIVGNCCRAGEWNRQWKEKYILARVESSEDTSEHCWDWIA